MKNVLLGMLLVIGLAQQAMAADSPYAGRRYNIDGRVYTVGADGKLWYLDAQGIEHYTDVPVGKEYGLALFDSKPGTVYYFAPVSGHNYRKTRGSRQWRIADDVLRNW